MDYFDLCDLQSPIFIPFRYQFGIRVMARDHDRTMIIEELRINDTRVSSSNLRTSFFQQWENDTGVSKANIMFNFDLRISNYLVAFHTL